MLTRKQLGLVHVAKKQLGLEDEDYRAILRLEAGVNSARDLDAAGLEAVMWRFKELGFKHSADPSYYGDRAGMASPGQVAYIRNMWANYTDGEGTDRSLGKLLDRVAKVSDIKFLTTGGATKAITALRAMVARKAEKGPRTAT